MRAHSGEPHDRSASARHHHSVALRSASIALVSFLAPAAAWAASDDSCDAAVYEPPRLHSSSRSLARDGWIALERGDQGALSFVRLRDASGRGIALTPVFADGTSGTRAIYDPAETLEPGDYELVFTYSTECFEPQEVTLPVYVADWLAEPAPTPPVITEIEAVLWSGGLLEVAVEVDLPSPDAARTWLLIDADFAESATLLAPDDRREASVSEHIDDQDVTEVCARATFYDYAGAPSPTAELCTTDIEHRETEQRRPLSCSVGRSGSSIWALGLLLGVALHRRRRVLAGRRR